MLDEGDAGRTWLIWKKSGMDINETTKSLCDRNQMGLLKQARWGGKVIRNKARLVAQGYSQQKGIDYERM